MPKFPTGNSDTDDVSLNFFMSEVVIFQVPSAVDCPIKS